MLSPDLIVQDTDTVAARLATKGNDPATVFAARDAILARRRLRADLDHLRSEMKTASRAVGERAKRGESVEPDRAALADLKAAIALSEADVRTAEDIERQALLMLPNLPDPRSPDGADESANVVLRYGGPDAVPDPDAEAHWDIAERLGLSDPIRGAKLSGSGFALLRGQGARLLRALVAFGLDLHRDMYEEVVVPHLVRSSVMVGTGHLPKFADDAYTTKGDDLWLIPTGEVPLTAMHRDETISDLPVRYMTHTSCFRREAGSAGKDTRGFQRVHEFHKVEMVRLCKPEDVDAEFDELLADAEAAVIALGMPYRLVELSTGDLTFSSSRVVDIEVYAPGVDAWLEVSSVGNFTDFQSRRSAMRFRQADGTTAHPYTLNGSAMATPRVWAALLEHGVQPDGSVRLPEQLHPYMGTDVITAR